MSLGERAAVEGVCSQLKPVLAIEVGSMEGACLRRIAAHAGEAHSFDLESPSLPMPGNVVLHTGDSHVLLPEFLERLAGEGRNVDFVMVDGDHTPEGVRRDVEDLLNSPAVSRSTILIHDTANERVREGLDRVRFGAWPKVFDVDLDWLPGRLFAERLLRNELWYGLGLVQVDASRVAYENGPVYEQRYRPAAPLLAEVREAVLLRDAMPSSKDELGDVRALRRRLLEMTGQLSAARMHEVELQAEILHLTERAERAEQMLDRAERVLEDVKSSASWRVTEPLRGAKGIVARRKS